MRSTVRLETKLYQFHFRSAPTVNGLPEIEAPCGVFLGLRDAPGRGERGDNRKDLGADTNPKSLARDSSVDAIKIQ